jgi:hypothetical protein
MIEILGPLRRRRDAYRRILSGAPDVGGLLAEAEAAHRSLAPVRERWDEIRATLDPALLREVEALVEETRAILAELVRPPEPGPLLAQRAARAAYGA